MTDSKTNNKNAKIPAPKPHVMGARFGKSIRTALGDAAKKETQGRCDKYRATILKNAKKLASFDKALAKGLDRTDSNEIVAARKVLSAATAAVISELGSYAKISGTLQPRGNFVLASLVQYFAAQIALAKIQGTPYIPKSGKDLAEEITALHDLDDDKVEGTDDDSKAIRTQHLDRAFIGMVKQHTPSAILSALGHVPLSSWENITGHKVGGVAHALSDVDLSKFDGSRTITARRCDLHPFTPLGQPELSTVQVAITPKAITDATAHYLGKGQTETAKAKAKAAKTKADAKANNGKAPSVESAAAALSTAMAKAQRSDEENAHIQGMFVSAKHRDLTVFAANMPVEMLNAITAAFQGGTKKSDPVIPAELFQQVAFRTALGNCMIALEDGFKRCKVNDDPDSLPEIDPADLIPHLAAKDIKKIA